MKKLTTVALLAAALGAHAETTNTLENTNRIVVTATRSPAPIRSVASNPSVITAHDIEAGRYSSIPEALQKKAGVFITRITDNPSQASVNLRGFGGDAPFGKTLVLLNGRKLSRPDMASVNWAQIPMQAVERIEVIRGPNSVLYGDRAVGGVINIITKEASEIAKTTITASIGSYEAAEQTLTTSGSLDGLGYVAAIGHQSGDGYRDRSKYDTTSSSLRLSGALNKSIKAYVEISAVKEQHQLPGALYSGNRKEELNPEDGAREETINIQAGIEVILSEEVLFNLDGGFSKKNIEADFPSYEYIPWAIPPVYLDTKINTYTRSPKFTFFTPIADMNNELIVGVDLSTEQLYSKKWDDKNRSILNTESKVTKQVVSGYIADTLSLTDQLLLSGGYRMEKNKIEGTGSTYNDSDTHREEAWQVGLTWLPTDTLKIFASIDSTYRYPFFDEQVIYSGIGSDGFNPDLEAETGISYEVGVEYMPRSNLVFQATVFRTDMEDEIAWDWGGMENINLDKTTHRGAELSASYLNKSFSVDAYYTWMQSEFTDGPNKGNEIPWVPQNQLDLNVALFLTDVMTLNTHLSYMGSMLQSGDNVNSGDNEQSEYALVDLLIQYDLPTENTEATIFVGIDNVFATEYNYLVSWGGHYPAPERTYRAGLSITF